MQDRQLNFRRRRQTVRDALAVGGALFFTELVRRAGLLPSQVEEALSELAALGFVTSDSFDGLRALLVPSNKRPTFGRNEGKRRRKDESCQYRVCWTLVIVENRSVDLGKYRGMARTVLRATRRSKNLREHCCAVTAWSFVVCSSARVSRLPGTSWGEFIAGGKRAARFAAAISSAGSAANNSHYPKLLACCVPFARAPPNGELITLSAADPLNLQGILTPGPRIAALTANRILFRDGLPIAALEAGEIRKLADASVSDSQIETALKVGKLRPSLRPYYK